MKSGIVELAVGIIRFWGVVLKGRCWWSLCKEEKESSRSPVLGQGHVIGGAAEGSRRRGRGRVTVTEGSRSHGTENRMYGVLTMVVDAD